MFSQRNLLFVVSAPSGTGKTSLLEAILKDSVNNLTLSVSHTSRKPRAGEIDGMHYHFISKDLFEQKIIQHEFLEYANVHGNYYGTSKREIEYKLNEGKNIILEIDVQGAKQIKAQFAEAVLIFISPPSIEILRQRLKIRGMDSQEMLDLRIKNAKTELQQAVNFNYIVLNDDFEKAKHDLQCIFRAKQLTVCLNINLIHQILKE